MSEFAVIGLGRFGRAVARSLSANGESVLAVDIAPDRLSRLAGDVDAVATADTTSEDAVKALRLERMSAVVVTIGSRATEASLLTTAILRELDVPRIVARAFDERHARLLLEIGASEVLIPEDEVGSRLALRLSAPRVLDQIPLGDVAIAEIETPEGFVGRSLAELGLRARRGVTVLAVRRDGETVPNPGGDQTIHEGDILVVMGRPDVVRDVAALK